MVEIYLKKVKLKKQLAGWHLLFIEVYWLLAFTPQDKKKQQLDNHQ